jgi:hypothetical protein
VCVHVHTLEKIVHLFQPLLCISQNERERGELCVRERQEKGCRLKYGREGETAQSEIASPHRPNKTQRKTTHGRARRGHIYRSSSAA